MHPLLNLVLCGAIAAPGVAMAQDVPAQLSPPPALAPLPAVEPTEPAPSPVTAAPPPTAEAGPPAPELAPPERVAPVIVAKEAKGGGAGTLVGTTAVGVAGGAAGAAVAGPVGKFAGGFVARRLAQGLFGKKDKTPSLTVTEQTPPGAPKTVLAEER